MEPTAKRRRQTRERLSPQRTFGFKRRDGHRAGRKARATSGVPHLVRDPLGSRFPVHVVLKLESGLPGLRNRREFRVLQGAFVAGRDRFGFRLNHDSVQGNHRHLIAEAKDREALSRGMKGLAVRIAKGLNKLWDRKGKVFADRYFDRILRTPREVKNALRYVLLNAKKHGAHHGTAPDHFSSGPHFDGWRERHKPSPHNTPPDTRCVTPHRTWLQRIGWRQHGPISTA